ncbi:MAG: alpha/beta fold hydrolase, partial [Burkholderiales bacterium]
ILASVQYTEVILPACLRQRRWIALSLPGHFPAQAPPDYRRKPVTPSLLTEILSAALNEILRGTPCVLMGHSTGGLWSLLGAGELPERVRAVCSISGFAQGKLTGLLGLTQKIARAGPFGKKLAELNLYLLPRLPSVAGTILASMAADKVASRAWPQSPASLKAAMTGLKQGDAADYTHLLANLADLDITESVKKIRQPCLVIHGANDPVVPVAQATLVANNVKHAELAIYPGVGHLPFAERPQRFEQDLDNWLRRM